MDSSEIGTERERVTTHPIYRGLRTGAARALRARAALWDGIAGALHLTVTV